MITSENAVDFSNLIADVIKTEYDKNEKEDIVCLLHIQESQNL